MFHFLFYQSKVESNLLSFILDMECLRLELLVTSVFPQNVFRMLLVDNFALSNQRESSSVERNLFVKIFGSSLLLQ